MGVSRQKNQLQVLRAFQKPQLFRALRVRFVFRAVEAWGDRVAIA